MQPPVITEHSYDAMENNVLHLRCGQETPTRLRFASLSRLSQREGGQGEHPEREVEAEARSLPGGSHPHLEEGHGHPGRGRDHRDLRFLASSAHRAKGRKPEKPRPAPAKGPAFLLRAVARGGFLPCRSVVSDIFPSLATGVLRTRLSCEAVTRHFLDKLKVMPR